MYSSENSMYGSTLNQVNKEKSPEFFQNTRTNSCNHVIMRNGKPYAIPFKPTRNISTPKEYPIPHLTRRKQPTETNYSLNFYEPKVYWSASYNKKLKQYDPDCDRNRLPD